MGEFLQEDIDVKNSGPEAACVKGAEGSQDQSVTKVKGSKECQR